jgi:hypothetical protein
MLGVLETGVSRADDARPDEAGGAVRWSGGIEASRLTRADVQSEPLRGQPGYRSELSELNYRWWLSRGRVGVGLGLGTVTYGLSPTRGLPGVFGDESSTVLVTGTVLTLGMRYRTSAHSVLFADAAGVRGLGLERGDAVVGKVGVDFKLAQSRWNVSYGGLGMGLAGDTRMTLRLRKGGLGLYMRSSF